MSFVGKLGYIVLKEDVCGTRPGCAYSNKGCCADAGHLCGRANCFCCSGVCLVGKPDYIALTEAICVGEPVHLSVAGDVFCRIGMI